MKVQAIKYHFIFLLILAFLLPLHAKLIPPFIILVCLLSFFADFRIHFFLDNKTALGFVLLYLIYLAGMIYTEEKSSGWFDLQVKLSLLVLPFALLPVIRFSQEQTNKIYNVFIIGCITGGIICLGIAGYNFFYEKWLIANDLYNLNYGINFFLSSRLSYFIHPSYFSMYIGFAMAILLFKPQGVFKKRTLRLLSLLFLFGLTVLLASKAGIIVLTIIGITYLIQLRSIKYTFLLFALFGITFLILYKAAPEFANKFINMSSAVSEGAADSTSTESTSARVMVWKSAKEIIIENPVFGAGTGDVKKVLLHQYSKNGFTGLVEKELNAHNQFIQTTIATGILGLLALMSLFVISTRKFIQEKSFTGLILVIILLANFMVESMLETQAGVVFFAFWLMFETYKRKNLTIV